MALAIVERVRALEASDSVVIFSK